MTPWNREASMCSLFVLFACVSRCRGLSCCRWCCCLRILVDRARWWLCIEACCTRISLIRMRLDHLLMYGFVFISCIHRNANEKKSESQPIMPSGYNNAKPIYRHIIRCMDGAGTKFNSDTNSNSFVNKVKTSIRSVLISRKYTNLYGHVLVLHSMSPLDVIVPPR